MNTAVIIPIIVFCCVVWAIYTFWQAGREFDDDMEDHE